MTILRLPTTLAITSPIIQLLSLIGIVCLLSACQPSADSTYTNYLQRLERLVKHPVQPVDTPPWPLLPQGQPLVADIPQVTLSLLDLFALSHCRLGQTIAQRNSSLGKVMTLSEQLLYEVQLVQDLADCLNQKEALKPSLRQQLQEALEVKQASLPLHIQHFLLLEPKWRTHFYKDTSAFAFQEETFFDSLRISLEYFATQFQAIVHDPLTVELDSKVWNKHLQTLQHHEFLKQYWATLLLAIERLKQAEDLLLYAQEHLGCTKVARPQAAEYLYNVLMNVYVPLIQPSLAQWAHEGEQIEPILLQLAQHSQNQEWIDFVASRLELIELFKQQTRAHAQAWQGLLSVCRLALHLEH